MYVIYHMYGRDVNGCPLAQAEGKLYNKLEFRGGSTIAPEMGVCLIE